jgi:iron complex outermembrane receptor protein
MRVKARVFIFVGLVGLIGVIAPRMARAQSLEDLKHMSVDELANIDVLSLTKTAESLSDAPGSIFVITHDDIVRSGARKLPEILRLAPNLQVAETSASRYVITARGFSGNSSAQSFSNKLLVLIDGRSVYTPLYSGVYWDMQDVVPEDIDRIEVISGPGATLWGANAVNGVINITTRKSAETQGGLVQLGGGNQGGAASLRYGGRINDALSYRVYARTLFERDSLTAEGHRAHDNWSKPQGGFRLDWAASARDAVTFQGDAYRGTEDQSAAPDEKISGGNLLARWNRAGEGGSNLQVQTYYDRTSRTTTGAGGYNLDAYDLDIQHSFSLGRRNELVWGGGYRVSRFRINGNAALQFVPANRTLDLANGFVQDSLSITDATKLIVGLKLEDDPYSGVTALPSARLAWKPSQTSLVWAAVSRAVRSPTPFDRDVVEKIGTVTFLTGGRDFTTEKLIAYELGARVQPSSRATLSVSAFYNEYDDLRSIETTPVTRLPLYWGNEMWGHTLGLEAWGEYRMTPWWRLSASLNVLDKHLKFQAGPPKLVGLAQAGDDPKYQASLKSSMNLGAKLTLDAHLRYVGTLPDPRVPAYTELNTRVGWNLTDRMQLSLSGFNLLHERHQEFPAPEANAVPRSFTADLSWRF